MVVGIWKREKFSQRPCLEQWCYCCNWQSKETIWSKDIIRKTLISPFFSFLFVLVMNLSETGSMFSFVVSRSDCHLTTIELIHWMKMDNPLDENGQCTVINGQDWHLGECRFIGGSSWQAKMDSSPTVNHDHLHYTVHGQFYSNELVLWLSGDNLTKYIQERAYFLFVINLITWTKEKYQRGRRLKFCGTVQSPLLIELWESECSHGWRMCVGKPADYRCGRADMVVWWMVGGRWM